MCGEILKRKEKLDQVNNAYSAFIILINLLINQGCQIGSIGIRWWGFFTSSKGGSVKNWTAINCRYVTQIKELTLCNEVS